MHQRIGKAKRVLVGLAAGGFLLVSSQAAFAHGRKAKNVILMISDGQGFNTVKATEYYTGSKAVFERFGHKYGMQTYSAGKRDGYVGVPYDPAAMATTFNYAKSGATDSASAATAMYTGVNFYDNEVNYTPGGRQDARHGLRHAPGIRHPAVQPRRPGHLEQQGPALQHSPE